MNGAVPVPIGAIGHYNLLERLEPSGPGELYRARDTRAGRTVMVRVLPSGVPPDGERARFFESARAVIALSHPNVLTLYEAGEHDGRVFLVFEFLKGQSLRAEMGARPMNVRRAVELAIQIADGVADAHGAGFLHAGLSPESVMVTAKGRAKIPAFELASPAGFEPMAGGLRLRDYDAPEEARGQAPDDRSDTYSVGAILYEMLTARRPMHKGAAAPSASNPRVFPELDGVVLRAVAPNPDLRVQSAAALAAELRALLPVLDARGDADEEEVVDEPAGIGRLVAVAVVLLLVLSLAAYLLF